VQSKEPTVAFEFSEKFAKLLGHPGKRFTKGTGDRRKAITVKNSAEDKGEREAERGESRSDVGDIRKIQEATRAQ